jgi:hypothetical protein
MMMLGAVIAVAVSILPASARAADRLERSIAQAVFASVDGCKEHWTADGKAPKRR